MTTPVPRLPDDPLGDVLHSLRLAGTFYCHSELTAPWGLTIPAMPEHVWFHIVTAGQCLLDVEGAATAVLGPGELALVPHGRGHRVGSERQTAAPDVAQLPHQYLSDSYALLRHGGGGEATTLVCGAVRFAHPAARELAAWLPYLLHVDAADDTHTEWLRATLRLIAVEAATPRPGSETLITRLSDIVIIQAIRTWLAEDPKARTGWLGALRDPQIGRALLLIHRDPARPWTVASLAAEAAMSRSAFAARFTALTGDTVIAYLRQWRMRLAQDRLAANGDTVSELADGLGYHSEAAFSRAFKRVTGVSPSAVRRP